MASLTRLSEGKEHAIITTKSAVPGIVGVLWIVNISLMDWNSPSILDSYNSVK